MCVCVCVCAYTKFTKWNGNEAIQLLAKATVSFPDPPQGSLGMRLGNSCYCYKQVTACKCVIRHVKTQHLKISLEGVRKIDKQIF